MAAQSRSDSALERARQRILTEQNAAFEVGDYPRVIASMRTLAELNIHDEETWSNLIWMYGNVDDAGSAWWAAHMFKVNNPEYAESAFHEAQFWVGKRAWAKVPPLLEPALKRATPPGDPVFYRVLALAYYRLGYFVDSIRVSRTLLKRWPGDPNALANVAKCEALMKRKPSAAGR